MVLVDTDICECKIEKSKYKKDSAIRKIKNLLIQFEGTKIKGENLSCDDNYYWFSCRDIRDFRTSTMKWEKLEEGIWISRGFLIKPNEERFRPRYNNQTLYNLK